MPNQIYKAQSFPGSTLNDQYNSSNTDSSNTNTAPISSSNPNTNPIGNPTPNSNLNPNSNPIPNINPYQQLVNMQAATATATTQGILPEAAGADFQHPPPLSNSFPRHITLPTYAQSIPRLIRASSINNEEYLKNDDRNNKFLNLKVTMEFQGDINSMTMNWTPKEIENSRRLVAIGFKQHFNHLIVNFKPIDQSYYIPGTPVISCIYWNQTNKFYVTSVDLITLLEYLVNAKFPVEEKNRIRRNLQSLKPLTISKLNPKFYKFFQLIMNFQNPKPRHIEKDVKVLSWSTLRKSLQKVLSKYTIDPTIDNGGAGTGIGIGGAMPHYDLSGSRAAVSTGSSTLNSNNSANSSIVNNPSSSSSLTSGLNTLKTANTPSNQLYNSIPDTSSFNYSLQPPIQESFYPYYQYPPSGIPPPQGQQPLPQQQPNTTPQGQPQHMNYQQPIYNHPPQVPYQLHSVGPYQDQQYQHNPQIHGQQQPQQPQVTPPGSNMSQSAPSSNGLLQAPVPAPVIHQQNPGAQDLSNQGTPSNPLSQGNNNYNMYYYR